MTAPARRNPLRALVEIEPGKPALAAGLRMTVTIVLPVAAGIAAGDLATGFMIAIGALNVGLTDDGSPYGRRLLRMTSATVILAVSILAATMVGNWMWPATLLMLVWGFACGLTNLFSSGAATVAMVTLVVYVIGIGLPGDLAVACDRFLQFLAGGAFSVVLSNVLWPLHPWKPIERSVAAAYRALAGAIAPTFDRGRPSGHDAVADAVETALEALVANRAGHRGPAPTAEQLLLLLRIAERADETLLAIRETISIPEPGMLDPGADWTAALTATTAALGVAVEALAAAVEAGGGSVDLARVDAALGALLARFDTVRLRATTPDAVAAMNAYSETTRLTGTLVGLLHDAADGCRALAARRRIRPPADPALPATGPRPLAVIRENLTFRSAGLRHALRLAVTAAVAVVVGRVTGLGHAYWVTLTVVVILKPTYGATIDRGLQRVVGTVLGALFAALLVGVVKHEIGMLVVLTLLSILTFSLVPLNYGLYTFFLTPLIVLLLDLGQPEAPSLALDRALDTVIGGGLAFLGGYLLWPTSERLHLPGSLADAAGALRAFVGAVLGAYLTTPDPATLRSTGALATLTVGNAEAALQRLVTEPARRQGNAAAVLAFVAAARRLRSEAFALAVHAAHLTGAGTLEGLGALAGQIDAALRGVAAAVRGGQVPLPLPEFDTTLRPIRAQVTALYTQRAAELAACELVRMVGDVEALHAAAVRFAKSE